MGAVFVLVHSPLVGPATWKPVQDALLRRATTAVAPEIQRSHAIHPFWEQQAADVAAALRAHYTDEPLVLVGHSGAGLLLPAIGDMLPQPVHGYVFVDAGIPFDGHSRLDLMRQESPHMADQLLQHLQSGGRFPEWSDADLRTSIPDAALRAEVLNDMRPQPLEFFTEPIPVAAGWPGAPCSYIQFTPGYGIFANRARSAGWQVRHMAGGHFHMLVDPDAVAAALLEVVQAQAE